MTPRQSRPTHLANLDLNLLVTLRALLRERNVTRAARNLGVTQPAVSASLSRLRRHFADELLVRVQGAYVLTPLAAQLAGQVETVCAAAERLFATGTAFDPATTQREFTLLMADYPATVLGPALSRLFDSDAPHAALHLQLVRETLGSGAGDTIRLVDGLVSPSLGHFRTPGVGSVPLFRDRWVCLVSAGHPLCEAGPFGIEDLARLPWVVPYHRDDGYPSAAPATRQLTALGIRPRIAVRVESYRAVPDFIAGTRRVALIPERLTARLPSAHGLRTLDCPVPLDSLEEHLWWDASHDEDPAHSWLRELVARAADSLGP
ncbi:MULTISPECIES: LysR family transcriptional regulator [unclassified Streptomyces]|uniref:LysR family transcriptional regulator n=1 Tax=unclassified Streptomyces TaxID=2593676 RepID=UPI002DDC7044|nr:MULTISPECIES: LysR family transcriptional regulator [unclassified Streptomyces]WSC34602.1 LysR family transcriptional regulator [Streptomyces sp. NBC_01763]WSC43010.1 LysR family transcriptional regulator [Streptomyces sp. NBC_01762]WSC58127.1 LysR family transcriptional regulator [Streptomyces sp. NBC_01761]WSF89228.1 LysR family transcriptional regulator [Streptomyces sp. NBC_01744]